MFHKSAWEDDLKIDKWEYSVKKILTDIFTNLIVELIMSYVDSSQIISPQEKEYYRISREYFLAGGEILYDFDLDYLSSKQRAEIYLYVTHLRDRISLYGFSRRFLSMPEFNEEQQYEIWLIRYFLTYKSTRCERLKDEVEKEMNPLFYQKLYSRGFFHILLDEFTHHYYSDGVHDKFCEMIKVLKEHQISELRKYVSKRKQPSELVLPDDLLYDQTCMLDGLSDLDDQIDLYDREPLEQCYVVSIEHILKTCNYIRPEHEHLFEKNIDTFCRNKNLLVDNFSSNPKLKNILLEALKDRYYYLLLAKHNVKLLLQILPESIHDEEVLEIGDPDKISPYLIRMIQDEVGESDDDFDLFEEESLSEEDSSFESRFNLLNNKTPLNKYDMCLLKSMSKINGNKFLSKYGEYVLHRIKVNRLWRKKLLEVRGGNILYFNRNDLFDTELVNLAFKTYPQIYYLVFEDMRQILCEVYPHIA